MNRLRVILLLAAVAAQAQTNELVVPTGLPFQDPDRPLAERVADLLGRLTLEERVTQLETETGAVPRLGIPSYSWWGEAIHGVARAGRATMFPQSIALAATWDTNLMFRVATAISDEARAKFRENPNGRYRTLTFWAPAADLTRDPRWGRAQETYGEDPLLVSRMTVEYIRGMQGDDPRYLKTAATMKHFGAHSQETGRTGSSFDVPERALWEYFFPPFEAAVREGRVAACMIAHNGVNSLPAHMNRWLQTDILRRRWGFDGVIFSDLHGTRNLQTQHQVVPSVEEALRAVFTAGLDVPNEWKLISTNIITCVTNELIPEARLNESVARVLTQRFRLGLFDPTNRVPYNALGPETIGSAANVALAREAARAGLVLLKNEAVTGRRDPSPVLPLDRRRIESVAVLGPYADRDYFGTYVSQPAQEPVGVLDGIRAAVGAHVVLRTAPWFDADENRRRKKDFRPALDETECLNAALAAAARSDVVVLALGLGEKHEFEGKDRLDIGLPRDQQEFAEKIVAANPATIAVLFNGGPLATVWLDQNAPAIVEAWLPGEQGGHAIADVLFGDYNPAGRLPLTVPQSLAQVLPLRDYDIHKGRTYLYQNDRPLYPFGHGLSYTTFEYRNLRLDRGVAGSNDTVMVTFDLANTGPRDGDEVAQLYVRDVDASLPVPHRQLRGFARVHLGRGQTQTITMPVRVRDLAFWDDTQHGWRLEPGQFEIEIGPSSADRRLCGTFRLE
jgi:beta-glucosidase